MAKELQKPNDMLVSSMVNGNVDVMDLLKSGVNAGNTQFLDPQSYKETKLVKEKFTDKDGNFREDLFNQQYMLAAKQYQELAEMNTYKKLEDYIEYNVKDIFAPLTSKKKSVGYEISPEINPMRRLHGVKSLFEYGDSNYSMRELAQMSNIWDSEKGEWMDKTAQDRGILGSLFGQSLVYATYDEDTETIDPITGRKVKHKKGEWKLNDKGQYYTETIGNRSGYGKQFVVASDTLTKEGSALNKIDFFDSDDIEKSTIGTVMKTVTKIAPYLIPGFNVYWGGLTAGIEMAKVMPTFAKMVEGIAIGGDKDKETAFTRTMNSWENYFAKYDKSYSDKGMQSNWGAEKMLDQVSDIFAQLYEMRAAASLSKFVVKDPTRKAMKEFSDKYMPEVLQAALNPNSGINLADEATMQQIVATAVQKMPSMKAALDAQSKLSKALSVGYMALSSSADVYSDALAGGFDRRMAGMAGLTAALGQYGIMMAEDTLNLGGWFLDSKVGYHEGVQRATMMKALQPHYKEIADAMDKVAGASTKEEKAGIINKALSKILPKIKNARMSAGEGAQYLRNGLTEALEEVTEEAIMDASKGIYDFLSYAGFGDNPNASFGTLDSFTSGAFLERYLQNAVGGLMGGVLFEFQQKRIEPFMEQALLGKKKTEDTVSLIHEIANGHTADLYKALDEMAEIDSDLLATPLEIDGQLVSTSATDKGTTRGQAVAKILKQYIQTLEGVLIDENANLTDELLLRKAVRDIVAVKTLENFGTDKMLVADFTKLAAQIADLRSIVDQDTEKNKDKKLTEEEKKTATEASKKAKEEVEDFGDRTDWTGKNIEFIKALLEKKRAELNSFLKGEKAEEYLYKTLVLSTPEIRSAIGGLSKADYSYLKYGKEYSELSDDKGVLNKKQVDKEWEEWDKTSDINEKLLKFGAEAYKDFDKRFGKFIKDYDKNGYGSVRKLTFAKLLSAGNLTLNDYIDDEKSYQHIKLIANYLKGQEGASTTHTGDIVLDDIFTQDELLLTDEIKKVFDKNPQVLEVLKALGKDRKTVEDSIIKVLAAELGQINVDNLSGETLSALIKGYIHQIIKESLDERLQSNPDQNLFEVNALLRSKGINIDAVDASMQAQKDTIAISDYLTGLINLNGLQDISVGLGTSLLNKYLTSEDVIDDVVKLRITEEALRSILRNISENSESIVSSLNSLVMLEHMMEDININLGMTASNINDLINLLNDKFDSNESIDDIINEWSKDIIDPVIQKLESVNRSEFMNLGASLAAKDITLDVLQDEFLKIVKPFITDDPLYKQYKIAASKDVKQNSIYDSLASIGSVLTESGNFKVLDILKQQHHQLRAAERFENYLPQQETEQQLESALRSLQLYKALLFGMRDDEVSLGSPFAINQQMNRFKEQNKIQSDTTYDTINADISKLIYQDLSIKELEIKGYLQFKERAYLNKTGQDAAIKKKYCEKLIEKINNLAVAFALDDNGYSILPPENEREKQTPEETLAYMQHALYERFHSHFKSGKSKAEAIEKLIKNLNLSKEGISRASRPTSLTQEIKDLTDYDLVMWIATSLGADSNEFYYRYNDKILNNKESHIVPFFSQEMAAMLAWSFAKDGNVVEVGNEKISIHAAIIRELFKLNPEIQALPAELMFFINGITGAGKSTVVGSILSVLLGDKKQYITAPNQRQIENYTGMIERYHTPKEELESGSIYNLFQKVFGKDAAIKINGQCKEIQQATNVTDFYNNHTSDSLFKEETKKGAKFQVLVDSEIEKLLKKDVNVALLPEVIFIDEVTQVSQPRLQILNYLSKKYGIKIIASGDSVQRGASFDHDSQAFNDLFMYKSAKLNISVRSANNQISINNVLFNKLLEIYENHLVTNPSKANDLFSTDITNPLNQIRVSYYQDENTFNGYKLTPNLTDFKEDIKSIAALNKKANESGAKMPVMVITELDSNNKPTNTDIEALLKDCGLTGTDIEFYSPADIHAKAVQGSEARYVIVDGNSFNDPQPKNGDSSPIAYAKRAPGELLRAVYTFASRAQQGALLALPLQVQLKIGIRNAKDKYTQKDEVPQLAKAAKLKEDRLILTKAILGDWKPEKLGIDSLEVEELKDGTKLYKRIGYKAPTSTSSSKAKSTKSSNTAAASIDHNAEASMSEDDQKKLIDLTNVVPEIDHPDPDPTGTPNKGFTPKSEAGKDTDSVRMYASMDVINVEPKEGSNGLYVPVDDGINFNLNGLFDPKRLIFPHLLTGLARFKHLLLAAKNKEDIVQGIAADNYIAVFLAEACPSVAFKQNITKWDDWKTSDQLGDVYSKWFRDEVEIDDKYYIFGKSLDWKTDKPINIFNPDINKSVGEGNAALYFGIRIKSKNGELNQYLSLGTMSKMTLPDGTRVLSDELVSLYDQAEKALKAISDPKKKFVAYKLNDSSLFDTNMSSTMWIRRIEGTPVENTFLSISDMRKRGFDFDTKHMYYVDNDKVMINGDYHYRMLVIMAKYGTTAADINSRFEENKLTFEQRLKNLEEVYVDKNTGNLRVAGSYWTFARYINAEALGNDNIDSKAFNRIIFLNGRTINAADVFTSLKYDKEATSREDREIRRKLASCSPASLTQLITELLAQVGAFKDIHTLRKYVIGWKNSFHKVVGNGFAGDLETLNGLLDFINGEIAAGRTVNSNQFKEQLQTLKHRVLFYPFFVKYVFTNDDGTTYRMVDASKFDLVEGIAGVPVLQIKETEKQAGSQVIKMDQLSDSVAYPVLAKNDTRIDIKEEFNLDFTEEGCNNEDFGMFQINFDDSKLANNIGIYGYELQDPTFQIKNSALGSVSTDENGNFIPEASLEQLSPKKEINEETGEEYWIDPRFPQRNAFEELPTRKADLNLDNFHPHKLSLSDFYEDKEFSKYIHEKEEKKSEKKSEKSTASKVRKYTKYDPKTKTVVKYDFKSKKIVYWSTKQKKWLPSKMTFVEYKALKSKETTTSVKNWDNKYVIKKPGKSPVVVSVTNDLGWEVRPGDYVQINGETGMSFYVAGIDRTKGETKVLLSHYSHNGNGEEKQYMTPFGKQKSCSIEDVTAVVKRTIPKKSSVYTSNDVYITGNFKEKSKFESGEYIKLFKTADTLKEMLDAKLGGQTVESLDFGKNFYIAVPIKVGEESDYEVLYNPVRPDDVTVNISGLGENLSQSRYLTPIETTDQLLSYLEQISNSEANPEIAGFTLFKIYRRSGESATLTMSHTDFISKLQESISEGKLGYIAHQILFNGELVNQNNQDSSKSQVLQIDYVIADIMKDLSSPEEIVGATGDLDLNKLSQFEQKAISLTLDLYLAAGEQKGKYPERHWMHRRRVESDTEVWYDMIPRPEFYFEEKQPEELKQRFNAVINRGMMAPQTKQLFWERNLKSLVFIDRQSDAYDPVPEYENGKQRDKKEVNAEKTKKERQKSVLELNSSSAKKFVIISVQYDQNKKEFVLGIIPEGNYGQVYDPKIIKYMSLKEFIASVGARFKVTTERKQPYVPPVTPSPSSSSSGTGSSGTGSSSSSSSGGSPSTKQSKLITSDKDIDDFINHPDLNLKSHNKLAFGNNLKNIFHICLNNGINVEFTTDLCQKWISIMNTAKGNSLIALINMASSDDTYHLTLVHALSIIDIDSIADKNKVFNALITAINDESDIKETLKSLKLIDDNTQLIGC